MGHRPARPARMFAALSVVAMAAMAATGCSSSPDPSATAGARDLVVGATAEPVSLDPTTATGAAIQQALLYNVYETLVKIDGDGNLKPLLAQSWDVSPDRRTYTFHLQPQAKFSNGDPVDAAAVVANINRVKTGKGQVFAAKMAAVQQATATSDHTVTVKLAKPSQQWLYDMAMGAGIIASPKAFSTLATAPVASGPFTYSAWTKGQSIELSRNQGYWGTAPHFDTVTFRYFTDANALTSAMAAGDLDVISDLTTPEAVGQFSDASQYTVTEGTSTGIVTLGFNMGKGGNAALRNVKVRQAINYAIDRKALLDSVWGGKGVLVGSMVPPTDPWYEDLSKTYPYNPAKAKQLLAQAGVKNLTLHLRVPTLPYAPSSAQFIASELKQVGITAKVDQLDFPRWLSDVFNPGGPTNYDMTIVNHVEPHSMLNYANPSYYWHYDNPKFTALVNKAEQSGDAAYVADMKQASRMLTADAAGDWLWVFPHIVVSKPEITGITKNQASTSFDVTTLAASNG